MAELWIVRLFVLKWRMKALLVTAAPLNTATAVTIVSAPVMRTTSFVLHWDYVMEAFRKMVVKILDFVVNFRKLIA